MREIFDTFVRNCKSYYSVDEYVFLDEMLFVFWSKCNFQMYMPNKPKKYGIKVFATVDTRTFYTNHMEIYAGQQPPGPCKLDNSILAVTLRMCQPLSSLGRNVTMDRWSTFCTVAEQLITDHRLTVL